MAGAAWASGRRVPLPVRPALRTPRRLPDGARPQHPRQVPPPRRPGGDAGTGVPARARPPPQGLARRGLARRPQPLPAPQRPRRRGAVSSGVRAHGPRARVPPPAPEPERVRRAPPPSCEPRGVVRAWVPQRPPHRRDRPPRHRQRRRPSRPGSCGPGGVVQALRRLPQGPPTPGRARRARRRHPRRQRERADVRGPRRARPHRRPACASCGGPASRRAPRQQVHPGPQVPPQPRACAWSSGAGPGRRGSRRPGLPSSRPRAGWSVTGRAGRGPVRARALRRHAGPCLRRARSWPRSGASAPGERTASRAQALPGTPPARRPSACGRVGSAGRAWRRAPYRRVPRERGVPARCLRASCGSCCCSIEPAAWCSPAHLLRFSAGPRPCAFIRVASPTTGTTVCRPLRDARRGRWLRHGDRVPRRNQRPQGAAHGAKVPTPPDVSGSRTAHASARSRRTELGDRDCPAASLPPPVRAHRP